MKNKHLPENDPISAFQRNAVAARRAGEGAHCNCGENRARALDTGSSPRICAACKRKKEGKTIFDNHHIAGEANNPATAPVFVNDHRAYLNAAQYDWPKTTLENPEGCPLLAAAGCIRGVIDYLHYLIDRFLRWIPELLESLSAFLRDMGGLNWWAGTPIAAFVPNG